MAKLYYDVGINNETNCPTIRFSTDGDTYFYVEFGTLEEFNQFVSKVIYVARVLNANTNRPLM